MTFLDLALGGRQTGAVLHSKPVRLARELVAELLEEFLVQELILQRAQHARFNFVAADGQVVVATALVAGGKGLDSQWVPAASRGEAVPA